MKIITQKIQQFQWQKIDKLSGLVLAILILWLCWKLASLFWWIVAPPQVIQMAAVELGSQQAKVPNISRFMLFNEPMTVAQDNIKFELQGVLEAQPNALSSAVIKVGDKTERYRIGETIGETSYQLSQVYWDHVVITQGNGATREIKFQHLEKGLYQPITSNSSVTSQSVQPTEQSHTQKDDPQSALGQAIQQMEGNRDQYLKNMGLKPSENGYEISDQTPAGLKSTLGLRSGDRILSVNGQSIGSDTNEVQLLEQVRREGHAKIEIQRGDQVMTIQQSF